MGEVIKDERENNQPAQHHRARGEGGFYMLLLSIADRPRPAILQRQADREKNVEEHVREEEDADNPKQRSQRAEMFRVRVDPIRSEKNLEIAQKMSDHERDQDHAGYRDDHLLADR